jgi:hypothetical protein
MLPIQYIYILKMELTENGTGKLPFVCCKQKWKTQICFPWSAKAKRQSTIAVSANMPIYIYTIDDTGSFFREKKIEPGVGTLPNHIRSDIPWQILIYNIISED